MQWNGWLKSNLDLDLQNFLIEMLWSNLAVAEIFNSATLQRSIPKPLQCGWIKRFLQWCDGSTHMHKKSEATSCFPGDYILNGFYASQMMGLHITVNSGCTLQSQCYCWLKTPQVYTFIHYDCVWFKRNKGTNTVAAADMFCMKDLLYIKNFLKGLNYNSVRQEISQLNYLTMWSFFLKTS